ncbi:hypothetical protein ABZY31_18970 [Streptomyces sp. NPDC006529]|uniref:hypothetical protein n=1 Tax=Streptomyces sp. NPDC006529 TaxID=3157177 RepID=UPI0033BBDA34
MKYTKVAAVLAGSVAALGAVTPAFAAEAGAMPPMSLTGGATEVLNAAAPISASLPQTVGNGLAEQGDTVGKVVGTAQKVNKLRNAGPTEALGAANTVTQLTPMLGGVKLNNGSN